jgi:hypothetical protein
VSESYQVLKYNSEWKNKFAKNQVTREINGLENEVIHCNVSIIYLRLHTKIYIILFPVHVD